MITDTPISRESLRFLVASLAVVGAILLVAGVGVAQNNTTINDTAPYYNNSTGNVSSAGWVPSENATLDSIGQMSTRFLSTFIGFGQLDSSGTGYQGVLLLSVIIGGVTIAATVGTGVGPVGGSILGMTTGYGLVGIGIAPVWVKPILLFGIGITAAVAFKRILR